LLTPAEQLQVLLGRLATCVDNDTYLILIRQAVTCCESVQFLNEPGQLFPLLELLAVHADDKLRSGRINECARLAIEQIITTGSILRFILCQVETPKSVSQKALLAVLKAGGTVAITLAIEQMAGTGSIKARRTLSTLLEFLGESAVPALLDFIDDSRWFIVRNICVILGVIASRDALQPLIKCLNHSDLRVRKEAIRSLAQLGGRAAETAVINVLRSTDSALQTQAIASLGGMRSRLALAELMIILFQRDMFLKTLQLKIDVLAAISAIGDRQVVPHLVTLLNERHLLAAERRRQLRIAVANCLGKLGASAAIPSLQKLASQGGVVGAACADAIAQIEKTEGKPDEIS
jgi:HEAT repeat protein